MSEQINSDNLAKNVGNKAKEILGKSTQVLSNKLASYGLPVDKIAMQREKAMIWVSNNKWRVITGLLISLLIIFYFVAIYNRIPRYLARMEVYDINVAGLSAKNEIMNNDYCLVIFGLHHHINHIYLVLIILIMHQLTLLHIVLNMELD